MAGNCSAGRAEGHFSAGEGEAAVCTSSILGDEAIGSQPQYPVAGSTQNPFKLCDFPLVTPARLLY